MPIFLLLIAGAIDLGRLFYAYVAIVNASKEGALYGASNPLCDAAKPQCPDPLNVVWHVQNEAGTLRDSSGRRLTPTVACLAPSGSPIGDIRDCEDGDTYRVSVDYSFRLITPILGSLLDRGLVLHAQADATVLNKAFDPTPGVSVTKTVRSPKTGKYERTPVPDPATGDPIYLEFTTGDRVDYRITVRNSGGTTLTSLAMTDSQFGNGWAPTTMSCPSRPKTLAIGASYTCSYSRTADSSGQPSKQVTNTVSVDALEISSVQDVAIITVIANPPELAAAKQVNVFRNASPFGSETQLTVFRNSSVSPTVWYRLRVTNTGGLPATGFSLRDSFGPLPTDRDCPARPSRLDPGDSYACFYARTFSQSGSFTNRATFHSRETGDRTVDATVTVNTCSGPNQVVPNLVETPSGDPRTVGQARALWSAAGFSGSFSPSGQNGKEVADQNRDPFECRPASSTVTVQYR